MPERRIVQKVFSEAVQGSGSWVKFSTVKVGEVRGLRKANEDEGVDPFEAGLALIQKHLMDWNWVDDEGQPLPNPQQDPNVINDLTHIESEWLAEALVGTTNSKN
jgi:hypothetical protein